MPMPNLLLPCGIGAFLGILSHKTLFIHGEWHVRAPEIFLLHTALSTSLFAGRILYHTTTVGLLCDALLWMYFCSIASLFTSITLYRAFFHPLTKVGLPGPWYLRLSKLPHVWAARKSKNHLFLEELHQKYGDFVRTGPAEITIFHPEVYNVLDGPRSECVKSEWYDIIHPFLSLVSTRDKEIHAARRREWLRGFTSKALAQHEEKILKHIDELERRIEEDALSRKPSEVRDLFYWFGFDVMGDFIFNKSFNMLSNQEWHYIVLRLQRSLAFLGPLSPAPWLIQLGLRLGPRVWVFSDWHDSMDWARSTMRTRLQEGQSKQAAPDLTYYLVGADLETATEKSLYWMHGDSLFAIVAGSEPTASVLIAIFCELAKHPSHAEKIYQEVQDVDVTDQKSLNRLPHLNAVINETLRLYTVVPTAGARKTMKEGVVVGGVRIPPYTTIVAPRFSISRREDCFEQPTTFVPERWTTRPEMIRNMAAFNPFGIGHTSCLGRLLSMDTMRYVTARLVKKYRFHLAPGETGLRVLDDMADQFTANPGKLTLCFERRGEE
ncbi:cytochrome P450 [Hypoxylon sp. FL1857]|nr:cytochrome P450 [Hypoxylon sp. FL1857]